MWGVEACAQEDVYAWDKVAGANSFTRITLTERNSGDRQWRREVHCRMRAALTEIKPQVVVIPGWAFAEALGALDWCVETNTPVVVMSESTAWDEPRKSWKESIKGRVVRLCAAGLAGGTSHAAYLEQLGMPRARIFLGYDVVDNGYFAAKAGESRTQETEYRKRHGLPGKYFLASARFIEKKNLSRLIEAFARYRKLAGESESWDLVLLGDGPLRSSLIDLCASLELDACVHLPGFKQYDELPAYFGLAGAFVHASTTEQWGLVVNEAMASGLPVLVSNRCGCARDLVMHGVNGFTFDPHGVQELGALMQKVSAADFPRSLFGSESRRIIADWGPDRFAQGLHDAVAAVLKNSCPRARMTDRFLLRLLVRKSV